MSKIRNLISKVAVPVYLMTTAISAMAQPVSVTPPAVTSRGDFIDTGLWKTIETIVGWVVGLVGVAAVIFLLYGAYMYMSAGANEENAKKGKAAIVYGIIGAVVAILAWSIFTFAGSFITSA